MSSRLTIVIPTFNRGHLLARAVESALAQASERIRIYVSDNASTDDTEAVMRRYSDPRLKYVRRAANTSRHDHGRLILPELDTEYHLCLSDDDWLEPDFSSSVLELFDRRPDLSFVYTGSFEHFDDEYCAVPVGPEVESPLDFIREYWAYRRVVSWCACVCRTADMQRIGMPPDDRILGDVHFWSRIAFQGPVGCVARPLSHYTAMRPGGDNESKQMPVAAWASEFRAIQDDMVVLAKRNGADEPYLARLKRNMARFYAKAVAFQFVYARIHGSTRRSCLGAVPKSLSVRDWTPDAAPPVVAALILPRALLRWLVVSAAGRRNPDRARGRQRRSERHD